MPTAAPAYGASRPARRGGRPGRPRRLGTALLLALLMTLAGGQGSPAHAAPLVVPLVAGAGLPLSVVSAGVGGGVTLVSSGAAMAGAGITAAAALAGNWAVGAVLNWNSGTSSTFGDPPAGSAPPAGWVWNSGTPAQEWPGAVPGFVQGVTATVPPGDGGTAKIAVTLGATNGDKSGNYYVALQATWACSPTGNIAGNTAQNVTGGQTAYANTRQSTNSTLTLPRCQYLPSSLPNSASNYRTGSWVLNHHFQVYCYSGGCTGNPTGVRAHNSSWILYSTSDPNYPTGSTGPVAPGTTPLTFTPRTCYVTQSGAAGCTAGQSQTTTRSGSGVAVTFPAPPAGATVTGRSAPITTADGTQVGDGLAPGNVGATPTVWQPPAVPARFPDCANRSCVMTLTVTDPAGNTQTCGPNNACASYASVVQQYPATGEGASTVARQAPDGNSYQCRFGPYAVAVAECQVVPGVGVTAAGPEAENCMGGVGWNPTTWVTVPVKCALSWAFVPSSAPLAQAQATATSLGQAAPFSYVTGTVGWVNDLDAGSQCFDLDVDRGDAGPLRVLSTCAPGPFEAWLISNRGLMTAALYAAFFVPMAWWAWRQYAPGSQGVA